MPKTVEFNETAWLRTVNDLPVDQKTSANQRNDLPAWGETGFNERWFTAACAWAGALANYRS